MPKKESSVKDLEKRIASMEDKSSQEALVLIEMLANINFFGQLKNIKCEFLKNDKCYLPPPKDSFNKRKKQGLADHSYVSCFFCQRQWDDERH